MHEAMTEEINYNKGYDKGWSDAQEYFAKKFEKVLCIDSDLEEDPKELKLFIKEIDNYGLTYANSIAMKRSLFSVVQNLKNQEIYKNKQR